MDKSNAIKEQKNLNLLTNFTFSNEIQYKSFLLSMLIYLKEKDQLMIPNRNMHVS